jgi:chromosome segregation ATPase
MIEGSVLITIIPPMFAALLAYFLARKRNLTQEKVQKARIDAEIQTKSLEIVSGVVFDVRKELESIKNENSELRRLIDVNKDEIGLLQHKLQNSDELVLVLKTEIASLQSTIRTYEKQIEILQQKLKMVESK